MSIPEKTGRRPWWHVALGPALAALVLWLRPGDDGQVAAMAAVAVWMAAWWITEAAPIPVTALLPLVLLPVARIAPIHDVAACYGRSVIFLFLGGFLIALALQASGAHRRVALAIVSRVGSRPRRLVLGFMLGTWALSMWISNTSTALIMLPIVLSLLQTARDQGADDALVDRLGLGALLGVAYAANMGGMATLVGTPPNLAFTRIFAEQFPAAPEIGFLPWMLFALPFSVAFLGSGWLLLTRVVVPLPDVELLGGADTLTRLRDELGPVRRDERVAGGVFAVTALLWLTSASVTVGETRIPGWRELAGLSGWVDDGVVAIAMAILLCVLPSGDRAGERVLEWRMASQIPWGLLLLFGGGFALAEGFGASGFTAWAGERFAAWRGAPPWLAVAGVCLLLTFLTELTSNLAATEMLLPIVGSAAVALSMDPRALMIPATLSASCAFMMPIATPPAAIVYGTGLIPIRTMVRAGVLFNLLGVVLVLLTVWLLGGPVLGIDVDAVPAWAH